MSETRNTRKQAMTHLEPAELLSVLRAAKERGAREWSMIVLAYKHGLRASEVCNLRLEDIDLKNGSIMVDRLKGSLRTTQAVTEHRGEPLLNELKALREWLRQRPEDGSDFLFVSQKGGRLDRTQFSAIPVDCCRCRITPGETSSPRAETFDCQSPRLRECQSGAGEAAAWTQIHRLHHALRHDYRPASLESHHQRPDEDLLSLPQRTSARTLLCHWRREALQSIGRGYAYPHTPQPDSLPSGDQVLW